MNKYCLLMITMLQAHHVYAPTFGFGADTQLVQNAIAQYNSQTNQVIPQPNAIINSCTCPKPLEAIPIPLPSFSIVMQNAQGVAINSFTFPTNINFKSSLAILSVQIFPISNQIASTTAGTVTTTSVTPVPTDNTYAIAYTLQSPDGLYIQNAIQYPTVTTSTLFPVPSNVQYQTTTNVANPTSATITTVQQSSGILIVPTTIVLSVYQATTTLAQTTVFPNFGGTLAVNQQEILNGLCPMTQKFLISTDQNGNNIAATPMSGTYDTVSNTTTPPIITSIVPATNTSLAPATTVGSPILPISISLYNGSTPYTITLPQNVTFYEQDLLNGMLLYLYIYPPLYQNGASSTNFNIAAVLKTMDGMKFEKSINQAVPFTYVPLTYSISASSLEGSSTQVTSTIANTQLTQQTYNMLSPVSLRFFILQNNTNQIVIGAI